MRFPHTANRHLGRYFQGATLLDDETHIHDQLVALAVSEQVDAVLIAGDVHDRASSSADAVSLLDEVLSRLVGIAGNHDSAERIGFGGRTFEKQGVKLRGPLGDFSPVLQHDKQGLAVAANPATSAVALTTLVGDESWHAVARLRAA